MLRLQAFTRFLELHTPCCDPQVEQSERRKPPSKQQQKEHSAVCSVINRNTFCDKENHEPTLPIHKCIDVFRRSGFRSVTKIIDSGTERQNIYIVTEIKFFIFEMAETAKCKSMDLLNIFNPKQKPHNVFDTL